MHDHHIIDIATVAAYFEIAFNELIERIQVHIGEEL